MATTDAKLAIVLMPTPPNARRRFFAPVLPQITRYSSRHCRLHAVTRPTLPPTVMEGVNMQHIMGLFPVRTAPAVSTPLFSYVEAAKLPTVTSLCASAKL